MGGGGQPLFGGAQRLGHGRGAECDREPLLDELGGGLGGVHGRALGLAETVDNLVLNFNYSIKDGGAHIGASWRGPIWSAEPLALRWNTANCS